MSYFRGDTLSRVSSSLGENPIKTEKAIGAVVPALVSGLANRASTSAGSNELLDVIRRNNLDSPQYSEISSAIAAPDGIVSLANTGRSLLDLAFGSRTGAVTDWISSFAGITRPSSSSLMGLVAPLLLGQIGRLAGGGGPLTASSLQRFLGAQRAFLNNLPAGLSAALGMTEPARSAAVGTYEAPRGEARTAPVVGAYDTEPRRPGPSRWLWVLPLLLLALIPLFWLARPDRAADTVVTEMPAPRAEVATTGKSAPTGDMVERRLPQGVVLRVPSTGVESKLIAFIEDPNQTIDREIWFTFDRLEFETDSAALRPSSQEQLRNVAQILRAYPQVTVKIGGYTDNVGDEARNQKLSQDRAANTMNELVTLGVDRSRLDGEGYGEDHPVADNTTAEGRQRNRRIDIRVTKK
jgi:outer membrane protein OmpA-like peptidoglycan-associated protein